MNNEKINLFKLSSSEISVSTVSALKEVPYYHDREILVGSSYVSLSTLVDARVVFSNIQQFTVSHNKIAFMFLSGGTINRPKQIPYTYNDYKRSIFCTVNALEMTGKISSNQKTCLLHPFAPWAIGGIFQEALAVIGCHTLVLGLGVNQSRIRAEIKAFNPEVLIGPISLIVKVLGSIYKNISCRIVINAGELLHIHQKHFLESIGVTVCNIYGMSEFDTLGAECSYGSIHLMHDEFNFELIGNGNYCSHNLLTGELVVTPLHRQSFRVFRYRTGDQIQISTKKHCSCGLSGPIIHKIGREAAYYIDGVTINEMELAYAVEKMKLPIQDYQLKAKNGLDGIVTFQFNFSAVKMLNKDELNKIIICLKQVNIDWEDLIRCQSIHIAHPQQLKKVDQQFTERGKLKRIVWEI